MADEINNIPSTQQQAGTATLDPEHHQTQAAAGSPQAGGTAPGGQTSGPTNTAASTAATSTPTSTPQASTPPISGSDSQGSPWSPGSTSSLPQHPSSQDRKTQIP